MCGMIMTTNPDVLYGEHGLLEANATRGAAGITFSSLVYNPETNQFAPPQCHVDRTSISRRLWEFYIQSTINLTPAGDERPKVFIVHMRTPTGKHGYSHPVSFGGLSLWHNGIIEREQLSKWGYLPDHFDTEALCYCLKTRDFNVEQEDAILGSFAMFGYRDGELLVVRNPLCSLFTLSSPSGSGIESLSSVRVARKGKMLPDTQVFSVKLVGNPLRMKLKRLRKVVYSDAKVNPVHA